MSSQNKTPHDDDVSFENFQQWRKRDPVTLAIFKLIEEVRDQFMEQMTNVDVFLNASDLNRGELAGVIRGLNFLLDITHEQVGQDNE